jgi:hypothetical protein
MRRSVGLLIVTAACGSPPRMPAQPVACAGTLLEARAPNPSGEVDELVWLDASTLVAFVGGGPDPRINGVLVLDVAHHRIERAFRGLGPISIATPRAGSQREMLFFDQAYLASGWKHRAGSIDLATGCVRASDGFGPGLEAIDPVHDTFVISPNPDNASNGHDTLERWDASTLRRERVEHVPRLDALAYDSTSNLLVTKSYADDVVHIRDPITFDERGAAWLDIESRQGLHVRPARAQIVIPFMTQCTSLDPPSPMPRPAMRMHCREGAPRQGLALAALDPVAAATAKQDLDSGFDCDWRRMAWTSDGSRAVMPCRRNAEEIEWLPDAGTIRHVPRPPLDYWDHITWSPDGDTYAAAGERSTLDVRSFATGAVLWQIPLH